jgi:hypothetical protein
MDDIVDRLDHAADDPYIQQWVEELFREAIAEILALRELCPHCGRSCGC